MDVLRLRVRNEMPALEVARLAMLAHLAPAGLPERVLFRLELILEETLMNLIWHAYPQGGAHGIDIEVALAPDCVRLGFEDDGIAFDPGEVAERTAPHGLAEAVPGGLGLVLVRKSARRVQHTRAAGRNRLEIEVERPTVAASNG